MEKIKGGYVLIARKLLQSDLMDKPPLYTKLWNWMLIKAFWKDGKDLKRGQFLTSIKEMQDAMSHQIGYRKISPTKDQIRSAYEAFTKTTMITTTKTTRGMIITILNYDIYQDPENYEAHNENITKPQRSPQSPHTIDEEGYKKEKKDKEYTAFDNAESPPDFLLSRKRRKLTGKRLEAFNRFWDDFDYKRGRAEAVDAWIDIPQLTESLVSKIYEAAKREAEARPALIAEKRTPKMAQGWINARRWEDEIVSKTTPTFKPKCLSISEIEARENDIGFIPGENR